MKGRRQLSVLAKVLPEKTISSRHGLIRYNYSIYLVGESWLGVALAPLARARKTVLAILMVGGAVIERQ